MLGYYLLVAVGRRSPIGRAWEAVVGSPLVFTWQAAVLAAAVASLPFCLRAVTIGHSAAWTWDGEVIVFGHEPGGDVQPRCQETGAEIDRTLFFSDGETGETLGTMLFPRPQGPTENCTWHNCNVVPTDKGYILVSGNYQAGISVVDFTDPANAREIAYADRHRCPSFPRARWGSSSAVTGRRTGTRASYTSPTSPVD